MIANILTKYKHLQSNLQDSHRNRKKLKMIYLDKNKYSNNSLKILNKKRNYRNQKGHNHTFLVTQTTNLPINRGRKKKTQDIRRMNKVMEAS